MLNLVGQLAVGATWAEAAANDVSTCRPVDAILLPGPPAQSWKGNAGQEADEKVAAAGVLHQPGGRLAH